MLVLALDTATQSVVVGVVEISAPAESGWHTSGLRAAADVFSGNRHAETLGQLIPDVLSEAGIGMLDLAAVVVGLGPGPFTGLRIGIVTAAALGDALGRPVYGVCTHDAIAAMHQALAGSVPGGTTVPADGLVVVTDARRRECYWSTYDASGARTRGPNVARPADLLTSPDWRPDALVIGNPDFSQALGTEVLAAQPDPMGLVLAATGLASGQAPGPLEPLYLRLPDASPPAARKPVTRA
ncbi:MAG: tRNA (adenosine(37)-N6)-threonylcarbamoyltransferase complex dimerization subunit type 1 TsaB [Geodermatophilaceae bacterium]|nr:tRNA (adenosine(37)-N6)-threonylcarbamoyltransferase complex dimerization subunit type 1 TsaB [Geodermatophilaceae bacterium]